MKNKIIDKFSALTDKQKKILNLFALIFTAATLFACGVAFLIVQINKSPNGHLDGNQILSYMLAFFGVVLAFWKIVLLLIHTKKVKNMGTQEMVKKSNSTQTVKKTNFKSNGFEFVENKSDILIKVTNQFTNKEAFIGAFKSATLEYCEYVRKSLEK